MGLVAGAMSMAAGEYVSVSPQADTENADLDRERKELVADPKHEHEELASIYIKRGLGASLAAEVSRQLMKHDALGAHAHDELGDTRNIDCPAGASRSGVGRHFFRRSHAASAGCRLGAGICTDVGCFSQFAVVSRPAGLAGCPYRRRSRTNIRNTSDLLGGAGHGADSRDRGFVR